MEFTTEKIPTWALCYLIYGDASNLTDEDIAIADKWCEANKVSSVCAPDTQEGECIPYFTHYPAFGLPTDVIDCHVMIL